MVENRDALWDNRCSDSAITQRLMAACDKWLVDTGDEQYPIMGNLRDIYQRFRIDFIFDIQA